ncbi:MAG: magnesium chelatase ATPase subunit I [Gemmatimonadaceae bacterium]|jgi:magnesium chelatase subunit I|nr:magnesium chelatase ATPase subunit I [Gemmatimonadaceae bacterium]
MRHVYPFSAIVGQDEMKLALLLTAVDPSIGGVMVFGDRGTGKSTAVRGLAGLLPPMTVVEGCRYGCAVPKEGAGCGYCDRGHAGHDKIHKAKAPVPVVDLPLGATEDRVVGALDLEKALTTGEKAFEPGLLARAHRGFLYVDEVNLLEDHLVDLLLDAAATGENVVEREGVSVRHPARFVLVGSGNPEEGELRPQLLDRFGLAVDVKTPTELATRIEVIRRRDAFDRDPAAFVAHWEKAEKAVRKRIQKGRDHLPDTTVPDEVLERATALCAKLGTDGLRGELTLLRTVRAYAALEGHGEATLADLRVIAPLCLRHRLRRNVLDEANSTTRVERAIDELYAAA